MGRFCVFALVTFMLLVVASSELEVMAQAPTRTPVVTTSTVVPQFAPALPPSLTPAPGSSYDPIFVAGLSGAVTVPPFGGVHFLTPQPTPAPPGQPPPTVARGGRAVFVRSLSDRPARVELAGSLTIEVAEGFAILIRAQGGLASDPCTLVDRQPHVVRCVWIGPSISVQFATIPRAGEAAGGVIVYPAGWNLVSGPPGMDFAGARGSLFTSAVAEGYLPVVPGVVRNSEGLISETSRRQDAPRAGTGYWAYFEQPTALVVPLVVPVNAPGGNGAAAYVSVRPRQWTQIGNPFSTFAAVTGADAVVIYDAVEGQYRSATGLVPGLGAWVYSVGGGVITICPNGRFCRYR